MPTHDSDFGNLPANASHDDILQALVRASGRTAEWRRHIGDRVDTLESSNTEILAELRANTEETKRSREAVEAVRDGMTTLKTLRKVVVWFGGLAAACSAAWALWVQARGGKP